MQEQRLTVRLLKHWNMVRKDQPIPKFERFYPEPIIDLWPQCYMVSVDSRHRVRYRYEYIGEAIVRAYGKDMTGLDVDENAKQFPGLVMYGKLAHIVSEHIPQEDEGFFMSQTGKLIKYRACFLPFGTDKKKITHIIAGLSFRVF